MFGRLTRIEGTPAQIEEGVRTFEQNVARTTRELPGNLGIVLMVNAEEGKGIGVTYWADEKALEASGETMQRVRESATQSAGTRIASVDTGEVLSMERSGEPKTHTFIRINTLQGKPEQIGAALAAYQKDVLPLIKSLKGFRAATMAANAESGKIWVSTVWETADDREASEAKVADLRKSTAATAGAPGAKVELFESVHVEFKVGAASATS
jgi:heme-degrading monooxygenase HmoA